VARAAGNVSGFRMRDGETAIPIRRGPLASTESLFLEAIR
jgi:hypothetical protein